VAALFPLVLARDRLGEFRSVLTRVLSRLPRLSARTELRRRHGTDWTKCAAVESVPGKVSGAWVFRGTRLPVATIFENLEDGLTPASRRTAYR